MYLINKRLRNQNSRKEFQDERNFHLKFLSMYSKVLQTNENYYLEDIIIKKKRLEIKNYLTVLKVKSPIKKSFL
jgi:hypothetical protein